MSALTLSLRLATSYQDMQHGQYLPVRRHGSDRVVGAWVCCPLCGFKTLLSAHSIYEDGSVHPSVFCPMGTQGDNTCTWHSWVRLLDWAHGTVSRI